MLVRFQPQGVGEGGGQNIPLNLNKNPQVFITSGTASRNRAADETRAVSPNKSPGRVLAPGSLSSPVTEGGSLALLSCSFLVCGSEEMKWSLPFRAVVRAERSIACKGLCAGPATLGSLLLPRSGALLEKLWAPLRMLVLWERGGETLSRVFCACCSITLTREDSVSIGPACSCSRTDHRDQW